jgi:hypothetical protein
LIYIWRREGSRSRARLTSDHALLHEEHGVDAPVRLGIVGHLRKLAPHDLAGRGHEAEIADIDLDDGALRRETKASEIQEEQYIFSAEKKCESKKVAVRRKYECGRFLSMKTVSMYCIKDSHANKKRDYLGDDAQRRVERRLRILLDADNVEVKGRLQLGVRDVRLLHAQRRRPDEALVLGERERGERGRKREGGERRDERDVEAGTKN